ncbi:MAG: indolepyruvate oxidoreductase subunit beta family protein [Glaciimonas sp.]|nr:indolepyruvate oxidoreductase subunit beta family protein [Glaciimonas sp.]
MTAPAKAITIAVLAMGGEGGGVLADWIVDMAEHEGHLAQSTSVPGVAQRTGATIYYIELFPEAAARAAGHEPVLALMPTPGDVDIVIASELMEAGRAIQRGLVTPDRTTLITSTHRVYSMIEKMSMGDGRVDPDNFVEAGKVAARRFVRTDFAQLAEQNGSVISAALFGALAGTGTLPFSRDNFEAAIRRGGVGVDPSLKAFAAGYVRADAHNTSAMATAIEAATRAEIDPGPALAALAERVALEFPKLVQPVLRASLIRLADFQDPDYAAEYLERLQPILAIDQRYGDGGFRLLGETARHLALWMSYEDAIRVADLKIRRSRFARVANEVRQSEGQLLEIDEFMHPRVEEVADILPSGLGRWLLGSSTARRLIGGSRVVRTTSIRGFLQLQAVASLRRWRRNSLRFQAEHRRIADWFKAIEASAPENYELAVAIAECQRLVKGYGDTHVRGNASFDAIFGALPRLRVAGNPAQTLRRLLDTALADDSGKQLRLALQDI